MAHNGTKSIDVGSMFLIDLPVLESELNVDDSSNASKLNNISAFNTSNQISRRSLLSELNEPTTSSYDNHNHNRSRFDIDSQSSIANQLKPNNRMEHQPSSSSNGSFGNSLDRLASAINDYGRVDSSSSSNNNMRKQHHGDGRQTSLITVVEPMVLPDSIEQLQYATSLSDESFVISSSEDGSSSTSYADSSEVGETVERGSTTTREDSGVLDMKDLDGQLNNSYEDEQDDEFRQQQQEKLISNNTTATNLINKSVNKNNRSYINNIDCVEPSNWLNNKRPTNRNSTNNHNQHHHSQRSSNQPSSSSRRVVSTSLPIQVPARQMKKDLNKLKLNLISEMCPDSETTTSTNTTTTTSAVITSPTDTNEKKSSDYERSKKYSSIDCNNKNNNDMSYELDDVDDFLKQEYNENHQNHYPIDEFDDEHLRAEDNPMKLFESIQALARSLHEDAELFGSLPPKRMLESPIRSLALA